MAPPVLAVPATAPRPLEPADPSAGSDPHSQMIDVEVLAASGQDRATVRLTGARTPQTSPAWMWLDPDDAMPPSPTYVAVGVSSHGALCVDVVRAPDVLTVTGDGPGGRRLAAVFARQLVERGIPVTVVGPALGVWVAGAHTVRSVAEAQTATEDPAAPQVVFCAPVREEAALVGRLTGRSAPRTVVVLVGDARPGRWSIEVRSNQ